MPVAATTRARHTDQTVKETLESIAVAFILAFVFRAFVVEAFVIPTGSMAPTLLGRHMRAVDPHTGQRFAVDVMDRGVLSRPQEVAGPMSRSSWTVPIGTRISPGDRILVLKYLYSFAQPRRWDAVVFKDPAVPQQNFIKRLVGLPGEQLLIIDGNVYVRPAPDQPWSIARKSDHRMRDRVQRAVWQPLYHSRFVPLAAAGRQEDAHQPWAPPWRIAAGQWHGAVDDRLPADAAYHLRGNEGALVFDFPAVIQRSPGLYTYNQARGPDHAADQPVEDVRIAATVIPEADAITVELASVARLDSADGSPQRLAATLEADGSVRLWSRDLETGAERELAGPVRAAPPRAGVARKVELWMVDLEAGVWVNGRQVLRHRFELSIDDAISRPPPPRHPAELSITLRGSPAVLRDVEVDRDLYYVAVDGMYVTQQDASPDDFYEEHLARRALERAGRERPEYSVEPPDEHPAAPAPAPAPDTRQTDRPDAGRRPDPEDASEDASDSPPPRRQRQESSPQRRMRPGHGVLVKDGDQRFGQPFTLGPDQFYFLGDNSPMSGDSRQWGTVDPWVRAMFLADDPSPHGVVPRELLVGRAFFVYWPAPFTLTPRGPGFIPNFADMRFIH
jgi:signal peptidase I